MLLLLAGTCSALGALPPDAVGSWAYDRVCYEILPWAGNPDSLCGTPATRRQLFKLAVMAVEGYLQVGRLSLHGCCAPWAHGSPGLWEQQCALAPALLPRSAVQTCINHPAPDVPLLGCAESLLRLAATQPCVAAACLAHPALPALLERCAADGSQARKVLQARAASRCASGQACWAAGCTCPLVGGVAGTGSTAASPTAVQAVAGVAEQLQTLLERVASWAEESSAGSPAAGGAAAQEQGSGPAELQEAAAGLRRLLTSQPSSGEGSSDEGAGGASGSSPHLQRLRQLACPELLRQGAALAAALVAQQQEAAQQSGGDALEVARAAVASRSCCNLACPDWVGEAGKLMACKACLARYCSPWCQRQDWKQGGHKQCCWPPSAAARGGELALEQRRTVAEHPPVLRCHT